MLEAVHLCLFYLSDACLSLGWGREVVQDGTSCGSNRVKERNRFLQVSGFVLCLGFLPPTPILFIRFVWQEMASYELLLTQKRCCPSCSPNHLPSQLPEQAHCRYCLVLSLRGSSGFPKWCVQLLFILLLHLERKLGIIPKLALLDPSPPEWQRSIVLPGWLKQRDLSFSVSQLSWAAHTVLYLFPGHWASYAPNESLALPLPLSEL